MLTFQDQYKLYQQISQDFSAEGLIIAKRDINEGGALFLSRLGRKFNREYIIADIAAATQFYQLPSEVLRVSEIRVKNGNNWYPPDLIGSEEQWNDINTTTVSGNFPLYYYIRGNNELGLYPVPTTGTTGGLSVSYEPQHQELSQDDYTTGTVTVQNGTTTITHSANGFSQAMVGRWFQITDGSDSKWYKIGAFTSTATMQLENDFEGIDGSRTFRIGEIMKLPNGYHDAPVYFALERYYLTQNDARTAPGMNQRFESRLKEAKRSFARSTSRLGTSKGSNGRRPTWIDLTKPVTYP